MTRFARARGSKSSNKREPEEASSWSYLKESLLKKSDFTTAITKEEIQKCKDTIKVVQPKDSEATSWAIFEEDSRGEISKVKTKVPKNKKGIKSKKTSNKKDFNVSKKHRINLKDASVETVHKKKVEKNKLKNLDSMEEVILCSDFKNESAKEEHGDMKKMDSLNFSCNESIKKIKNKKDKKSKVLHSTNLKELVMSSEFTNQNLKQEQDKSKTKKNKRKRKARIPESETLESMKKTEPTNELEAVTNLSEKLENTQDKTLFHKNMKKKRKKPLPAPYQMDLNGEMVDVITYDGFPIMLKDAERLEELKKSLYAKGISNGEIKKIIKLQRRSAEKALTRARKKVCFNCRRSGHPLSECPSLNLGEGTGICFKCGSTEHTHFECKVVKKQEFKFAQCFICKEQGHISNQCPDNPRGLYPKGGACKLCGDVTHLKRFCPALAKDPEPTIDNFLDEEDTRQKRFPVKINAKTNKIVRF